MEPVERPIRRQIILSFYSILLWSIIATLITWAIIAIIFLSYSNQMNPANYFEKKIPYIITNIEKSNGSLLSVNRKNELEKIIPLDGMDYQVLNTEGEFQFGTINKQYIVNQKDLVSRMNTVIHDTNKFVQYYPVFDEHDQFIGSIGFRYSLTLAASNPNNSWMFIMLGISALFSPFIYIHLFAYIIGKRFSKKMELPFLALMEGTRKIQNHDLDFQLVESTSSRELNQLVIAFEEMRQSLKTSLLRQFELEEERKEIVAAIAHDLRTPLTIIHGHTEMLMSGGAKNTERLERYLQTIFSNTERSIRLINQLNEMSAHFKMEPKMIHIAEFLHYKTEEYRMLCLKKNISFRSTFDIEEHTTVCIDPDRIAQVLDNIITNSIRYCPQNGEIDWTITKQDKELIFEIKDNGPGFHSQEETKVFKKFYRGDEARSGTDSNFGLGLYIAQMIVKKHYGFMSIDNHAQGGAYTKVGIRLFEK